MSVPWQPLAGGTRRLEELLTHEVFERDGDELVREGLYVDLPAWGHHLLAVPLS